MRSASSRPWIPLVLFIMGLPSPSAEGTSPAYGFRNMDDSDMAALARGDSVFRQPTAWNKLSIPDSAPFRDEMTGFVRKGGFNYLGEVLLVVPLSVRPSALSQVRDILLDLESYAGIPYWSRQDGRRYDLFDRMSVVSRSGNRDSGGALVDQHMKPFDDYRASYRWSMDGDRLSFECYNETPIVYSGIKAVMPGNLVWRLEAYRSGDSWVFYGLGAVKAFDMFGALRPRLSASFMGRIEAFFKRVYASP